MRKLLPGMKLKNINLLIFVFSLTLMFYLIFSKISFLPNATFGAGDYYYTDLINFKDLFFGENSVYLGTNHPILFFILFVFWAIFCWYLLKWVNREK